VAFAIELLRDVTNTDCRLQLRRLIALADAFEELVAAAGSPEAPGAAADPEPPAAKRCPVCGAANPGQRPYCPVCGATL
jgi:hypothetical protein